MSEIDRIRRRDAAATPRPSRGCASTAGARTYRGMIPDAYLDGMQVDASTALWDRVLTAGAEHDERVRRERRRGCRRIRRGNLLAEPKHGLDAELAAVYLRREFQRAGLGRRLVGAVVDAQRALRRDRPASTWVIAGNKPARGFYEQLGGELLVEQPFQWDGMDLVEAGYGWRDLDALAAACRDEAIAERELHC